MSETPNCWNCGRALTAVVLPVSRHDYCDHCAEPVHCCRMCVHFDSSRARQCREDRTEPPNDKSCANFCDYFQVRLEGAGPVAADDRQDRARARLDALFGDDSAAE